MSLIIFLFLIIAVEFRKNKVFFIDVLKCIVWMFFVIKYNCKILFVFCLMFLFLVFVDGGTGCIFLLSFFYEMFLCGFYGVEDVIVLITRERYL